MIFMDVQNSKKGVEFWNLAIPGGLLFVSYLLLYYLPEVATWHFWVLFIVSTFLFCVGYFRLMEALSEPKDKPRTVLLHCITSVAAVLLFLFGLYFVYTDIGSERSLAVCTLLLIEGLAVITTNTPSEAGMSLADMKKRNWIVLAITILMSAVGFWLFCKEIASDTADNVGRIETATMLWIAALTIYKMCSVKIPDVIENNKKDKSGKKKKDKRHRAN